MLSSNSGLDITVDFIGLHQAFGESATSSLQSWFACQPSRRSKIGDEL